MAFRKLTGTKYKAYKILWLVSLLIHQNLNTSHQYSKNYTGFQSNNASITNCVFLKHLKFSNLHLYNYFFPSHSLSTRSSDSSVLSIPLCPNISGLTLGYFMRPKRAFSVNAPRHWNSHQTPVTRFSTVRSKLKTHQASPPPPLNSLPFLPSDCLPGIDSCFSFTFSPID